MGAAALAVAAVTAAERDWLSFGTDLRGVKSNLYPVEAQVFAAILGFLIAGAAVLVASANLERLKAGSFQLYKLLARSFRDSMLVLIGGIAYVVAVMIFDQGKSAVAPAAIAVVILILVLTRVSRAVRRLYLTLLI